MILSKLPENDHIIHDLVSIQAAQIHYLTEEQSTLLVLGQFNDAMAKNCWALHCNTSAYMLDERLGLLHFAVELIAAMERFQPCTPWVQWS